MFKENQLFAKYTKCQLWLRLVEFPYHIISSEVVEVNQRKTEVVMNYSRQLTTTDIRIFFGLVGFIRGLWLVLTNLKQKSKKVEWSEE